MSFKRRCLSVISAVMILAGSLAGLGNEVFATTPNWSDPAPLQNTLNTIVNTDGALGATAEVRDSYRGNFVGTAGVSDVATHGAVDPNSHFRIGSDSKVFVAIAVLKLQAAGKVSLDDTLDKFLAPNIVPNSSQITIRMLLSHTSGIFNYTTDAAFVQQLRDDPTHAWTPQQLVQLAASHPAAGVPGSAYSYSNTNFTLAAMIIEKLTGNFYGNAITSGIITPLGLSQTSVPLGTDMATAMHGYADLSQANDGSKVTDMTNQNPTFWYGAGQMVSTAHDMNTFYTALFSGQVLAPVQMALLKTVVPQATNTISSYYGLGLARYELRCGVTVWGHNGSVPGYQGSTFISNNGQRVYTLMYTAAVNNNDTPYNEMLDAVFCKVPLISVDNPADGPSYLAIGPLTHIFTKAANGHLIWARQKVTDGPWERIDVGGALASNPVAASDSFAHLRVFAQGTNGHLMMVEPSAGVWVDSGMTIDTAPSVVVTDTGRYDIFARASDKTHLLHVIFDGTTWQSETITSASNMASSPVAYSDHAGNYYVYYRRSDSKLGQAWTSSNGTWNATTIGSTQITMTPAALSYGPNSAEVYARGSNGHLMRASYSAATGWVWTDLGGVITTAPAVYATKPGDVHVFAVGTDKAIYERTPNSGTAWVSHKGGLTTAPGTIVEAAPIRQTGGGYLGHTVAMGTDGYLYETRSTSGSWSPWARVVTP